MELDGKRPALERGEHGLRGGEIDLPSAFARRNVVVRRGDSAADVAAETGGRLVLGHNPDLIRRGEFQRGAALRRAGDVVDEAEPRRFVRAVRPIGLDGDPISGLLQFRDEFRHILHESG